MKSSRIASLRFTLFFVSLLSALPVSPQSIKNVRINEIQVRNTDGFRDEYGQADSWIELYNTGYGKVNIAGCILKVEGKEFHIPKGNPAAIISTRGYLVLYADGNPCKGSFHTNFRLDETNFIKLYDIDNNLIDSVYFNPADMVEEVSYGWLEVSNRVEKWMELPATTPGSCNNTEDLISRAEVFRKADPSGVILTITNIVVVSIALTLLFVVFQYMGNYHIKNAVKKAEKKSVDQKGYSITTGGKKKGIVTNDELAAIAIALKKYTKDMNDNEKTILTFNMASKAYSPWSSKIYSLRQIPNKK